ncbi:MAG: hypothetical protein IJU48_05145 [Synergistaceae bacterium]|nr:hypothetical protein [Synergistaceae bacterium]
MENGTVSIRLIHPTNNSDIEIDAPVDILLRDIFAQLIESGFLTSGQPYEGVLKPAGTRKESVNLDNNRTVGENGIGNNDTISILITNSAG